MITSNPATRLYTPTHAPKGKTRAMTVEEVNIALGAVELPEHLLTHMAIFSGFRPGEMLALQRRHVAEDATVARAEQHVSEATSTIRKRIPHDGRLQSRRELPSG